MSALSFLSDCCGGSLKTVEGHKGTFTDALGSRGAIALKRSFAAIVPGAWESR